MISDDSSLAITNLICNERPGLGRQCIRMSRYKAGETVTVAVNE